MQKRKFRNESFCLLESRLIESEAFLNLSGKAAILVLIRFHQKAHRRRAKGRKGIKNMVITNNGQIIFTYSEAQELGISRKTFHRVLRELVEDRGFINIREPGNWFLRQPTKFAISERWKRYGTAEYESVKIERALPSGLGFQSGNLNPQCHG